jgi:predicted transcriptional regulator
MTQVVQDRRREHIATHVDPQTRERLFRLAALEEVSASAILRRALRRELERAEKERHEAAGSSSA